MALPLTSRLPLPTHGTVPLELGQLLHAPDAGLREAAWEGLIADHTRLLLSVARSLGGDHDAAMERYSYVLEKLREGDFRRLRAFDIDGRARFSTWLTVAARRLCLDHHRTLYGRSRMVRDVDEAAALRVMRRRLTDSIACEIDTDLLSDSDAPSAEEQAIRAERSAGLQTEIDALPAQDQLLLVLRFQDELSASRISAVLGVPTPFHVYRRLRLVLQELQVRLQARGIRSTDE
ncbi:MAG: sigma-70 family RNA polymerase sigma factor [Gemmatimonadota bacterium]